VPGEIARRALMLSGDLTRTAAVAMTEGEEGLREIGFEIFRPILPMLASTAESVGAAVEVLDGEAFWVDDGGVFLFDLLHVEGEDLLDKPLAERAARLEAIVPHLRIPAVLTTEPKE
jgi:ATP-dependent DNA ligase